MLNNHIYEKMFVFFKRYFQGFNLPIETQDGSQMLVQELVAGFKVIMENENIQYEDWFEELHYLISDEDFLENLITEREPHDHSMNKYKQLP